MPRPMRNEKSKDFKGSMKRLIKNLSKWKFAMLIAITLAVISAVFAIITPNKLSDFADYISEGLIPNTKMLEKVGKEIGTNLAKVDYSSKSQLIMQSNIPDEDKKAYMEAATKMAAPASSVNPAAYLFSMPDSVKNILLDELNIKGVKINGKDQVKFLELASKFQDEKISQTAKLKLFDKLPKSIYKLVKPKIQMDKIKSLTILLGVIYILSSIFSYIQGFLMSTVSNKFAKKLRSNISLKINRLPLKYFDNHETGDILSRVTNDIDTVAHNLNQSIATLITSITLFIGSIIMMFVTNYIMALTAIGASLVGFIGMGFILKNSQKFFSQRQEELGKINGYIEEIYSGHNVVKAYNGQKKADEEFEALNKKLYYANLKSNFLSGTMQPIMGFVGNFGYVAVCIVGALLTQNDIITFGVIVAFMIYVRLFTNPLSQIAQALTSLQSCAASSERVFEFLDEEEMTKEDTLSEKLTLEDAKGNIEFKHVKFGYDKDKIIINDFSAKVKPGQKIAIVGPTGAGKTTMVNLLMKFYEINDGDIIIDGKSIKDLTRENVHDLFCMVLQDTWLFDGTIKENVKYNNEDITDEEIQKALDAVGISHFVKTLSGGINAKVDDSDTISQGQKQLITIARGILEKTPFLILDEATSNVDTRTEELVQKAMDKLMKGKTSFIIAHRLSTIKNADLILVMKDGNIIEQGKHEELLEQNGFYANLYNSQFEL